MRVSLSTCLVAGACLIGIPAALCWYSDCGHKSVEKLARLDAMTLEEVVNDLGEPDSTLSYTMGECPGGVFRRPLWNYYPPHSAGYRDIAIKELWWKHARYTIVVWFHRVDERWIVLDSVRWKQGIEF
jgi:hypothetical protein